MLASPLDNPNDRISGGGRRSGFNIGGYTSEKDSITVSSQDHAINEQGLPGNGGCPKKGKVKKPSIKIKNNQLHH